MISKSGNRDLYRSKYLLLTGSTGFVGRFLLRDLLLDGHRIALIVRGSKASSARERIDAILSEWEENLGRLLPRPVIIEGELSEPGCGLQPSCKEWIQENCDRILHNAAVLRFHSANHADEPWRTNYTGTQNILQLCKDTGIEDFHFVSTAYVAGDRTGLVLEDELDVGQGFRNDYEKSKLEAEKLVRAAEHLKHVTVYRPAVIAGDSVTGYTSTYHGLFLYLRLMAIMVPTVDPDENGIRHTDICLPMTGEEPRNIVPVDWVSEVICHLLNHDEARGKTFHLAPDKPVTPKQVVEYGCRLFNSTGVVYRKPHHVNGEAKTGSKFEQVFLEGVKQYEPYDQTDPNFDRSNLLQYAPHLPCPEIDQEMIRKYFEFGQSNRWGKGKRRRHVMPTDVKQHLESLAKTGKRILSFEDFRAADVRGEDLATEHCEANGSCNHVNVLGLDLLGPGGGQWHLVGHPAKGYEVRVGLPEGQSPVLHLPTDEFRQLLAEKQEPQRRHYIHMSESTDTTEYEQIIFGFARSLVSAAC